MAKIHDFHLVIRSAGERTAGVAKRLALQELPEEGITVVTETPFEAALRATYESGIAAGEKWTMTLDADVLLRPGAVGDLLAAAASMPEIYFQLEGRVYDKVMGTCRPAGHRIYRTALLHRALALISEAGRELRPEYHTICKMAEAGFPSRVCGLVVGLHDFEQFYRDLYRKALLHSAKHRGEIADIITRCVNHRPDDPDHEVILKGLWDGLVSDEIVVDARRYRSKATAALETLGLEEKGPLLGTPEEQQAIEEMVGSLTADIPGHNADRIRDIGKGTRDTARFEGLRRRLRRRGPVLGSLAAFGAAMKRAGTYLDQ